MKIRMAIICAVLTAGILSGCGTEFQSISQETLPQETAAAEENITETAVETVPAAGTEVPAETASAAGTEVPVETTAAAGTEAPVETTAAAESENAAEAAQETGATAEQTDPAGTDPQAALKEMAALLGMQDAETADLLGGGTENWTEDKSFYIGRIYEVEMGGTVYSVYTSCDENNVVNSVSVWLSDGERKVEQEEAEQWVQILTEFTGTEPVYDETSSEVGNKNWKWMNDEKIITLNWMDTIFTISMNPAVGELK